MYDRRQRLKNLGPKEMKSYIPYIFLLLAICFFSLLGTQRLKEGFQSAGTLLQLETSHVPTRAELRDRQHWLRQRVRQDLWDMTNDNIGVY